MKVEKAIPILGLVKLLLLPVVVVDTSSSSSSRWPKMEPRPPSVPKISKMSGEKSAKLIKYFAWRIPFSRKKSCFLKSRERGATNHQVGE
jgi:hypothetical protein